MLALYIVLIILQSVVLIYFVRRAMQQRKIDRNQSVLTLSGEPVNQSNSYALLRSTALNVTPDQLKLSIPENETLVYGVIMDCNFLDATITLSAYITGAVSMCFNSGSVKTGGGMNPDVAESAADFVVAAQAYLARTVRVATTDLPPQGCVRFYLLTNHGVFVAQEQIRYFEDGSSAWLSLFEKGNEVIGKIHTSAN